MFSRIDQHKGNVIGLSHSLSELVEGPQDFLFQYLYSSRRIRLNDLPKSLFLKHLALRVLCIRDTIGIDDQDISRIQLEWTGIVGNRFESTQDQTLRVQLFNLIRGSTVQVDRIVASAQTLSFTLGIEGEEKEGDEGIGG